MNSAALYGVLGYIIHNAKHLKLLISSKRCSIYDPKNNEIHSHRWTRIRTINISYWFRSWGTSTTSNMTGRNKAHKMGNPFENLRSLTKQILQFLLQTKNCNVNQLLLPKETPVTLEIFRIPNLLLTLPETKLQLSVPSDNTNNMQHYISSILDTVTN